MLSKYIPAITIISLLFFITQCQQLDDNKRSPSTDGATVEIKPELVSPVNSSHNQSTSIAFNWSKMEGVNEFRFQLSTNAGFQSMLADTIIEGRSLLINSLELNSNYFWKVYPILEHDNISWSDTWRFKTATSDVEPIVTELHSPELGEYVTPQDLIFQWEAIHGVSQYYLQLARENDFNATLVDTLISTESLSVDELDNDNEYQWRVLPVAESFTGHWSEINDFILVDENDVEKSKVSLVAPENQSEEIPTEVILEWKKLSDFEHYSVQLSEDESFETQVSDTVVQALSFEAESLSNSTTYYWRVIPSSDSGLFTWSDTWQFTTMEHEVDIPKVQLGQPENSAEELPTDVSFEWEPADGFDRYQFQLSTESDFSSTVTNETVNDNTIIAEGLDHETDYHWRVRIRYDGNSGPWSEVRSFTTEQQEEEIEIPAVSLASPENSAEELPTDVSFEWKPADGFDRYQFQLSTESDFSSTVTNETVNDNTIMAEGLDHETGYHWRVRIRHDGNSGPWSEVRSFTTEQQEEEIEIPAVSLVAPENNSDEVPVVTILEWEQIDDADVYQIMINDDNSFSDPLIDETVSGTSFDAENLEPETTYYWGVRAQAGDDIGEWSQTWSFTTEAEEEDVPEMGRVTLSSPTDGAVDQPDALTFEWDAMTGTEHYRIMVDESNEFTSSIIDETVTDTSFDAEGLEPGTTYYWGVRAQAGDEVGEWSQTWSFSTEAEEEDVPEMGRVTLSSPTDGAVDQPDALTFEWDAMTGAEHYRIMVDESNEFTSSIIDETVTGTSFDAEGLEPGTTYYWGVRAQAGDDIGEWSQTWSFSTESTQIGQVVLSSPSDGASNQPTSVTLSWQELQNADEYQVQLASNSSFSNLVDDELVFSTPHNVSGLNNNQTYYWRVRGVVGSETGDWSAYRQFSTEGSSTPPPSSDAFVSANNGNFYADGQLFRFVGTNAYYLPNYEKLDAGVVNRAFNIFEETGITVIRMWAFYDGYDCGYSQHDSSENVIQTSPGVYSESALRDLDRVIAKGKERGIRFILPLVNYWDELGGICQYNTWAGASSPSQNMDFFINNSDTQKWFREYIEMLLNRVNTVTGVAYKDEPAIFAWQIINEGRNSGANPRILRDWYQEIAQFIKSITPNHMVSTGEEGFDEGTPSDYSVSEYSNTYVLRANEGTSYIMNTSIPEIDFGSAHWYPADWGFGTSANSSLLDAQRAWLSDHQNIAEDLGKPFVLGEWGFEGWGNSTQLTIYDNLYEHAESIQLDGSLLWQLTADGTKCWEFGGNICYPDGRQDTELYNRFRHHVQQVNNQ